MKETKKQRIFEIFTGICFILATLSYGIGNNLILKGKALVSINSHEASGLMNIGIALELINSVVVIAIGYFLYYCLKKENKNLMRGYLISRLLEGICLGTGSILVLLKIPNVESIRQSLFLVAMLILGVYSTRFCHVLINSNIGSKKIMQIGALGYVTLTIYCIIGFIFGMDTAPMWLFVPGSLFEIIFPIWLIIKGFRGQRTVLSTR